MDTRNTAAGQSRPSEAPQSASEAESRGSAPNRGKAARADVSRPRSNALVMGRLQDFGAAPYQFRTHESDSYFIKVLTRRGERVLWGKDLERALSASATQPKRGDQVGARRTGRDAVTIVAKERDAEGRVVRQSEQLAHRQRWVVEKVQFFAERAKLARRVRDEQADIRKSVKAHPELMSTFISLRGAQDLAERRIADPRDRERFLSLVREAMAGSIKSGEPLPLVRLRNSVRTAPKAPPAAEPAVVPNRHRDAPTR